MQLSPKIHFNLVGIIVTLILMHDMKYTNVYMSNIMQCTLPLILMPSTQQITTATVVAATCLQYRKRSNYSAKKNNSESRLALSLEHLKIT